MSPHSDQVSLATILRRSPEDGLRQQAHLLLHDLRDGEVTKFLFSEAWTVYLSLLYAMLIFRRKHELAPLHADLFDAVRETINSINTQGSYSLEAFAMDMAKLVEWGCVKKEIEITRIRGYKDRSREHFRYVLGRDTVSFLEWLEGRLDERVRGAGHDGRDLMLDLVGRLAEAHKLANAARTGAVSDDAARRLLHLIDAVDEGMDRITADLTALRAEMQAFARSAATETDLKQVVAGLEKYVSQYSRRMRELGAKAFVTTHRLAQKRHRAVLKAAIATLEKDRLFGRRAAADPEAVLDRALPFLEPQGRLVGVCSEVEAMASEVVRRIDRRLRDFQTRNFRLEEIRGRLVQISGLPEADPRAGEFLACLIGSAHFRHDPHPDADGGLARPPEPRRAGDWTGRRDPAPLRRPRTPVENIERAEVDKRRKLREYVRMTLLGGRARGLLSEATLKPGEDALGWLAVAKARYLASGRGLRRAGITAEERDGTTVLKAGRIHLSTADHELTIGQEPGA